MAPLNLKDKFRNGELDLSSCGLKEIPKDITSLKHITSLNLSNNKLSSVGKIIGQLTHLNKLDLSGNQIKGLPENIGNLTSLKHLNLSHNQIATLPPSLGHLKNLKHLDLRNNNLTQKFSEIVGSCQSEALCQQAAKNVLKSFSSNSDGEKKKKQSADKETKKSKSDKKVQNGDINQKKQKDRKPKKTNKGIIAKTFEKVFLLIRTIVLSALLVGIAVYILSFLDEGRYKAIKAQVYPLWRSGLTRVCNEEQSAKVEAVLLQAGDTVNRFIVTSTTVAVAKSKQFYIYVTTDEKIQQHVKNAKETVLGLWAKVSSGGEQKS